MSVADVMPSKERGRRSRRRAAPADGTIMLRDGDGVVVHTSPSSISSVLRSTITRLRLAGALPSRIGIVSSIPGEGTTFVGRSLAVVLAHDISSVPGSGANHVGRSRALVLSEEAGERVCFVDLNWSSPAAWNADQGDGRGVADVLRGEASLDDVIVNLSDPPLAIVPPGTASPNEVAMFSSGSALTVLIEDIARQFKHMIVDLPAVQTASESLALAARTEGVLVVVRAGVTTEGQLDSTLGQLAGIPVLGVILNDFQTKVPKVIRRRVSLH